MLELLLLGVTAFAGWEGFLLLRHGGPRRLVFTLMLLADAVAAITAWIGMNTGESGSEMLGWIAVGAFVFLVVVPGFLRALTRTALKRDKVRLALLFLEIRDLLQPGMGAKDEREALSAFADLRAGKSDRVLEALKAARGRANTPLERRAIDERIVHAFLMARRWREAVDHYEKSLESIPGPISAPVLVEVVRAYGELREREKIAALMRRIEESKLADEPQLVLLIARARLCFLAFAGRVQAVESLLGKRGPLAMMPAGARAYWIGVARRESGDRVGARDALTAAVKASGGDPRGRSIASDELAALDQAPVAPPPPSEDMLRLTDHVAEKAAMTPVPWLRGAPLPQLEGVPWRQTPVTVALIAANLCAALAVQLLYGSLVDPSVLADAGANVLLATQAGEWWRLVSSTFLHLGMLHLFLNMFGLWVLGRVVEQVLGPRRYFVVYLLAGIVGALASLVVARADVSMGASGALFGVLGAAIAEFGLRRKVYPEAWRRTVLNNLLFLAAAQLVIGSMINMIDQAAHVGGLVAGLIFGALLAPRGAFGRTAAARWIAQALAAGGVLLLVFSLVQVVRTSPLETLERVGWTARRAHGVALDLPRLFASDVSTASIARPGLETRLVDDLLAGEELPVVPDKRERVDPVLAVDGWTSREERLTLAAPFVKVVVRIAAYARTEGAMTIGVLIWVPERQRVELAPTVERIVKSARPDGG